MANLRTLKYKDSDVTLLFGSRWYRNAKHQLKFSKFEDITDRITDFDTEFIAGLLYEAHKEACFLKTKDLDYNNIDVFYNIIDEVGMVDVVKQITEAILDLSGYNRLSEDEKMKLEVDVDVKKKEQTMLSS